MRCVLKPYFDARIDASMWYSTPRVKPHIDAYFDAYFDAWIDALVWYSTLSVETLL